MHEQALTHTYTHAHNTVSIKQIKEVRDGKNTDSFKLHGDEFADDCSFSVLYVDGGKFKTLDLVALNPSDAKAWSSSLRALVEQEGIYIYLGEGEH